MTFVLILLSCTNAIWTNGLRWDGKTFTITLFALAVINSLAVQTKLPPIFVNKKSLVWTLGTMVVVVEWYQTKP